VLCQAQGRLYLLPLPLLINTPCVKSYTYAYNFLMRYIPQS